MRDSMLDRMKQAAGPPALSRGTGQGAVPEYLSDEPVEDLEGRSLPHSQFGLKVIWLGQGDARTAKTILYGSICGMIELSQEEDGESVIGFEFQATEGGKERVFRCLIRGRRLDTLHDYISRSRRVTLFVRGNVEGVVIEPVRPEE